MQLDVIVKRFEEPDESRTMTLGPGVGQQQCPVEHVGLVLSGEATVAFKDGRVIPLRAGELFYIPPIPHDSWVVGIQQYGSLHFMGAEKYAK